MPDAAPIRDAVLAWYAAAHRDFPFRRTSDPYPVLVSEVMLQQTQASRVAERFGPFMDRYPTADALAAATDADLLTAWSGLGYNRRALALRRAAASLAALTVDERVPSVADLERLPGVGPYTARAVASLAWGTPVGVVDTNVRRWLVRRFGLPRDATPAALQAVADALAASGRAPGEVAAWTHASMEFGAAICVARAPRCRECPVAEGCPSRDAAPAVPTPRQPPFPGSTRAARGALLRGLTARPAREVSLIAARRLTGLPPDRFGEVLRAMRRDGLLHRVGRRVRLGGG